VFAEETVEELREVGMLPGHLLIELRGFLEGVVGLEKLPKLQEPSSQAPSVHADGYGLALEVRVELREEPLELAVTLDERAGDGLGSTWASHGLRVGATIGPPGAPGTNDSSFAKKAGPSDGSAAQGLHGTQRSTQGLRKQDRLSGEPQARSDEAPEDCLPGTDAISGPRWFGNAQRSPAVRAWR
jgi:hypothetical protein